VGVTGVTVTLIAVSNPVYIQDSPFLRAHAARCRVIHFGIDLRRFDAPVDDAVVAQWRAQYPGKGIVLFVGRLRHYKGVDVLISALQRLPDARALVVGVGPMEQTWRRQAQTQGVADRVTFLGELSDAELVALYHAASIFVLPSTNRAETLGIVQLEAMACGLPLVCTELGTGTSYVNQNGQTGWVVPPDDADALAAALRKLLENPAQRAAMGAAGRERVLRHFSVQAMLEQTLALYAEAMGQSP